MAQRHHPGNNEIETFAVSFGATSVPLTAHTVWIDVDGKIERETHPIVGFVVKHTVRKDDGSVWESTVRPAIWFPEYGEAVPVDDLFVTPTAAGHGLMNEALIGVYPTGTEPSDDDVRTAIDAIHRRQR